MALVRDMALVLVALAAFLAFLVWIEAWTALFVVGGGLLFVLGSAVADGLQSAPPPPPEAPVFTPTAAHALAALAMGGFQGDPVVATAAAARSGDLEAARRADPLVLVDVVRMLAILGEEEVVAALETALQTREDGRVHFELGLAALMRGAPAEPLFRRALDCAHPQPMAYNSLAVVLRDRGDLDAAWSVISEGCRAMPDDPVTARGALAIALLSGRDAEARAMGFDGDPEQVRREAASQGPTPGGLFPAHADLAVEASRETMKLTAVLGERALGPTRHLLERALALQPGHPRATAGLAALP